jgi:hypothetical protein
MRVVRAKVSDTLFSEGASAHRTRRQDEAIEIPRTAHGHGSPDDKKESGAFMIDVLR